MPHLQGMKRPDTIESDIFSTARDPNVTWKDVDWLRSITRMPLVLKGVLDPADAEQAVKEGVDGIIVSIDGCVAGVIDAVADFSRVGVDGFVRVIAVIGVVDVSAWGLAGIDQIASVSEAV